MKISHKKTGYILLYPILFLYSISNVCAKIASGYFFLSSFFLFFYALALFSLMLYAVLWQQVLKRLPLSVAYTNKSITVILGMVWGASLFGERIKWNMLLGALIIISGVVLVCKSDE